MGITTFFGLCLAIFDVTYNLNGDNKNPISPCGICRQSLAEYEERTRQPIKIILSGLEGDIYIIEKASSLLPLRFSSNDL